MAAVLVLQDQDEDAGGLVVAWLKYTRARAWTYLPSQNSR